MLWKYSDFRWLSNYEFYVILLELLIMVIGCCIEYIYLLDCTAKKLSPNFPWISNEISSEFALFWQHCKPHKAQNEEFSNGKINNSKSRFCNCRLSWWYCFIIGKLDFACSAMSGSIIGNYIFWCSFVVVKIRNKCYKDVQRFVWIYFLERFSFFFFFDQSKLLLNHNLSPENLQTHISNKKNQQNSN